MLFTQENSLEEIFQSIKHELNRGALDPKHPFRFVTLATKSENGIDARYLVLRSVDEALNFYLFTDARTSKVQQLTVFPDAVLLFYHPAKRIQVKVTGKAEIKRNDELTATFWSKIQGDARKAYNQVLAPGTAIQDPREAFTWNEPLTDSNFTLIKITPTEIEALQLNGMEHLRIVMNSKEGNWDISWIAP
ncbi:pyridoxamine 5'-phosphate oxidase family protein [Aquiflexum gelatinilyticum]|uniref:Pyridoxamine 5'-phosphate oxidase family protein n=1 Tax=Aquiflexum gelatinilyticum TaxID=2961943 RepID=A0A9X2P5D3_9BACT|nr:pyridoxamine 5'-phosphate oxidase family protein [Aquiflexum gelatinilyticum]MCR9015166.1 pyridoxamine 5'-phosphate oxidase family protein [Aquiflexum gelatinilyticum]